MVLALVHVLETMECDLPIDVFLNRVQHEVQTKSLVSGIGQTAEMRFYAYKSCLKNHAKIGVLPKTL
jgi:hypothetical protein